MQSTDEKWHGTSGGYTNHKCRCNPCRTANAAMQKRIRLRRMSDPVPVGRHGQANTYSNYGCRCQLCREAYGLANNIKKGGVRPYKPQIVSLAERLERGRILEEKRAGKFLTYNSAHQRVRRSRGPASGNNCEFCGAKASDWALNVASPGILSAVDKDGWNQSWSRDVTAYRPLCRKCHAVYDAHFRKWGTCVEGGCSDAEHAQPEEPRAPGRGGRSGAQERTECINGHDASLPGALRVRAYDGSTECVQCNRERSRRYRATRRESTPA